MPKKILILLGHPAQAYSSFCETLALAYGESATEAGHDVDFVKISDLRFDPILHEGYKGHQPPEPDIRALQEKIRQIDHMVFVYPMWQFMIPALLKGFLERTLTPEFAYSLKAKNPLCSGLLKGKSARLIQTMGMPALVYRLFFGAHGAKSFQDILKFCGISPVRITYFGAIEDDKNHRHGRYLDAVRHLGRAGL